jgi:RNA polymerase sigma-70 factor (ECF subfamily)
MLRAAGAGDLLRSRGQAGVLRQRSDSGHVRMPVGAQSVTAPEPAAADQLWRELHARLRRFVRARISDPEAADDIAQEVLLRLHRSLAALRTEDRLDAFAYRIARNAIIDHYRARAIAKESPEPPDVVITHVDAVGVGEEERDSDGRQELARCLAPLIQQLPEPYREALTLTDLGKLSQVEAAQAVGLSIPGMKARVQRARAQVRELLTSCCEVGLDRRRQISEVRRTGPCACAPE